MDRTIFDIANKSLQTIGEVLDRKYKEIVALRAELAQARGQLCRAREALNMRPENEGASSTDILAFRVVGVLSAIDSSTPCSHEAENKRLRDFLESGLCVDECCLDCRVARNILEGKEDSAKRKHF